MSNFVCWLMTIKTDIWETHAEATPCESDLVHTDMPKFAHYY